MNVWIKVVLTEMRDDKVEKLKDLMLYDSEDSKIMEFIILDRE